MNFIKKNTVTFFSLITAVLFFSFFSSSSVDDYVDGPINDFKNEYATGKLYIKVKNWDAYITCRDLPVSNGSFKLCDKHTLPEYSFFIKRDSSGGNWYNDLNRLYDYFPETTIRKENRYDEWIKQEVTKSHSFKEDFKSDRMINEGYEYRHSESRRHYIFFKIANDSLPIIEDTTKYQFNYDWEEEINGRYQSYYTNGKKHSRHKYKIIRYSYYNRKRDGKGTNFAVDVTVIGKIEDYYSNGVKKKVVEYKDQLVREKTNKELDGIKKSKRTASVVEYYKNRKLKAKGSYSGGLRDGKWQLYHLNGRLKEKVEYLAGVKDGDFKEYSDRGKLLLKGEYVKGVRQ
jgi:antitoxin component YwqK of YwqJK toxin-antitoxin module